MEKSLNYSDICLVPEYSELKSRAEADINVDFLGRKFATPILPANMISVVNDKIAHWLSENDYFYIYHRFGNTWEYVLNAYLKKLKTISISIGVKKQDKELIQSLINCQPFIDFITIDVAHGHSILVKEMIEFIKDEYTKINIQCPKIISGNICTPEAVTDLEKWGADAIKIGIAGGGACSTKNMTGFHIPMFSCIKNCATVAHVPLIADGGIRENGDIAKAFAAGADMVMIGSVLAACEDAPGENIYQKACTIYKPGFAEIQYESGPITHKKYFGSASAKNKGENKHVEGFEIDLPCNGLTYAEKYQEIKESLQSAVSYAGGNSIKDLSRVEWITTK